MTELCKGCKKPMEVMPWSSGGGVYVCSNTSCPLFRQPVPIAPGDVQQTLAEELGTMYSKQKRRPGRRRYANSALEEKLQELREIFPTET